MKAIRFFVWMFSVLTLLCVFPRNSFGAFTISPSPSTNYVGTNVTLSVLEDGVLASAAYTYKWTTNSVALTNSARIIGAQSRELTILNLTTNDAGVYAVTVTSNNVVLPTLSVTVHVLEQPNIIDVFSQTIGADVTFRVTATGGLLSYQWLWQGSEIIGATTSALRFTNAYTVANAGYYSVRVTNELGSLTSSPTALLFTKPAPTGTYQGIYVIDGGFSPEACGYFQFTISGSQRSFSGKIISGPTVLRTSGAFSPAHISDIVLPAPGGQTVPVRLQLLTTNDTPQILGFSTNSGTTIFLLGNRLHYSSKLTNSLAGKYTLALINTNVAQLVPNGDGFATLKISSKGKVTLTGQAADGSKFSQSCGLSRLNDWPLYASLNSGRGRLVGLLRVAKLTNTSILGTNIIWVKAGGPDLSYPDGFNLRLDGVGSTFAQADRQPVVALTNGVAALHGGDLFVGDTAIWDFVQVRLRAPNSFVAEEGTERLNLNASKGNGMMTGKFLNPITGLDAPIRGVVLQQTRNARGFFLSTNSAGAFSLDRR